MASKKFMVDLDLGLNALLNAKIQELPSDPTGGDLKEARLWYNSTSKQLKYYNGTAVTVIASGGDLTTAVTRATAAAAENALVVSSGATRGVKTYAGGVGIVKSDASGLVSPAVAGTDYCSPSSTETLSNKSISGSANTITNLAVSSLATSALATSLASGTSSQLAVATVIKQYVDDTVAGLGTLVGDLDASAGSLPTAGSGVSSAIRSGDYWRISAAGTVDGIILEAGDVLIARTNDASTGDFFAIQANLTDTVSSTSNSTADNAMPRFDGTTGKIIQASGITIDDSNNINLPAGSIVNIDGTSIINEMVTYDGNGNIDLAAGKEFRVNGTSILTAVTHKYAAAFNDTDDWSGATAPFTYSVAQATHGLPASADIAVTVKDSTGAEVEVGVSVAGTGAVTISSNAKFAGRIALIG